MIKYFTGELAKALLNTEDNAIAITYANQIADDELEISIRDTVNNVHGLNENIVVKTDDESVVITIEATADLEGIGEFYNHRKPATFKLSEFELTELADHILQAIKSYHESLIENSDSRMQALTF